MQFNRLVITAKYICTLWCWSKLCLHCRLDTPSVDVTESNRGEICLSVAWEATPHVASPSRLQCFVDLCLVLVSRKLLLVDTLHEGRSKIWHLGIGCRRKCMHGHTRTGEQRVHSLLLRYTWANTTERRACMGVVVSTTISLDRAGPRTVNGIPGGRHAMQAATVPCSDPIHGGTVSLLMLAARWSLRRGWPADGRTPSLSLSLSPTAPVRTGYTVVVGHRRPTMYYCASLRLTYNRSGKW